MFLGGICVPLLLFVGIFEIDFKGTPGYKNKLIFIDCQWLLNTSGSTSIFIKKWGNKFLPGQFWPCLSFVALRHGPKYLFLILWTKTQPLYFCDMKLCDDGIGRQVLNGTRQLLSQLRIMYFNSKIITLHSDIAQKEFLLAFLLISTHNLS